MVVIKQNVIYDSEHDLRTDIYFPNDTSSKTKILVFWHGVDLFEELKMIAKIWALNLLMQDL